VAIIGASDRSYYARSVYENLGRLGFPPDAITLVNPNRAEAHGRACVRALETAVDLAVLVTPAETVTALVRDCAAAGVGACLVLSDGFAEAGPAGVALQSEAAAAARDGGVALVGPNTMGLVVPRARLGTWGGPLPPVTDGTVSAVFQSSGLLNLLFGVFSARRIGLRLAISVGNEGGVTVADALRYAVDDEGTRSVVMFVESIAAVAPLREALERADELGKPVVVLRAGRSERARRNVIAHTGKIASSGAAWDALFKQTGAVAVRNVDELIDTTALFARAGARSRGGLGFATISGGDCTLFADLAERVGVTLPEPSRREELALIVGKPALVGNPLDVENLWRADQDRFFRAIEVLCREPSIAIAAFRLNLPETPERMRDAYVRVAALARTNGKLPVFLSRASEPLDPAWHALFEELGTPFLQEYERALRAMRALIAFDARHEARHQPRQASGARAPRDRVVVGRSPAREILASSRAGPLQWRQTKALLDAYGITFAETEAASSADEAVAIAARMRGPVAVKAWLPHKSDVGAVRLDLSTPEAVRAAFTDISARHGGADVVVQRMERGVAECLVGVSVDPALGAVLAVGLGGVLAEVLADVALRVLPVSDDELRAMPAELRGAAVLAGVRGRPPADREALVQLLARVARLALDAGELLAELDLNPVVLRAQGEGAVSVDALVVRSAAVADSSNRPLASTTTA
jgi:acetyltransferase